MDDATLEAKLRQALSPARADGLDCSTTLYRYAAGELSPEERAEFHAHVTRCASCRADVQVFRGQEAAPARRGFHPAAWLAGRPLAAAGALALVVALGGTLWSVRSGDRGGDSGALGLRTKGGAALHVAVQRGERRFTADEQTRFEPGDTLGFFYSAPEETWPVVVFADAGGKLSRVFPQGDAVLVPPGVERALPAGAVVEPGTGCEWIVSFFSPKGRPPQIAELEAALRAAVAGHAPAACSLPLTAPAGVSTAVVVLRGG